MAGSDYYIPGAAAPPAGQRWKLKPDDARKMGIVPESPARLSEGHLRLLECLAHAREPNAKGIATGEVEDGLNHSLWRVFRGELHDMGIF